MTQASSFISGRLIERADFAETLARFRFHLDEPLSFKPGQYATIALDIDGGLVQRPYSIASAPHEPFLEFFVEQVSEGKLTPRLWTLGLGDRLLVRRTAAGAFLLDDAGDVDCHIFGATVTGVAPFISMLRSLAVRGEQLSSRILLIHAASHPSEFGAYVEELEELASREWFDYVPTVSRPWKAFDWRGETGRVEDVFRKHLDSFACDPARAAAYACGHPQMVANLKGILKRARFAENRVKIENYFPLSRSR